jgi:hypothetical protein
MFEQPFGHIAISNGQVMMAMHARPELFPMRALHLARPAFETGSAGHLIQRLVPAARQAGFSSFSAKPS